MKSASRFRNCPKRRETMHRVDEADSIPSTEAAAIAAPSRRNAPPDSATDPPELLPPVPPRWTLLTPSPEAVAALCAQLNISPLLATMLVNRRQDTLDR